MSNFTVGTRIQNGPVRGQIVQVDHSDDDLPYFVRWENGSTHWYDRAAFYGWELDSTDDRAAPPAQHVIPQDDAARKAAPMYRGLLGYFPGALFEVAAHSMRSDRKHNAHLPEEGAPRWNRGASSDHDDCIIRHTAEQHTDPLYHKTARAWRALADLQEYLEREEGYAPGAHSVGETK